MIYDIWSVRQDGDKTAVVQARPTEDGPPDGDIIKYLASKDVQHPSEVYGLDVVDRELSKVYYDNHPHKRGTIERKVFEKFGCVSLDRPNSWEYWARRYLDEIRKEFNRRGMVFKSVRHQLITEQEILWNLWRI